MSKYLEKLRSPKWQKKRLEILSRDNFTCQYCKDTETELQIHHLEYNGEPWNVSNDKLVTLCRNCHEIESTCGKVINVKKIYDCKIYEIPDAYFILNYKTGLVTTTFFKKSLVFKEFMEILNIKAEVTIG